MNRALTMLMTVLALAALGAVEADKKGEREGAEQEKPASAISRSTVSGRIILWWLASRRGSGFRASRSRT